MYATNAVSQRMGDYDEEAWRAVKHLIKYLNYTKKLKLVYKKEGGDINVTCYVDASYAECKDTRRSHSCVLVYLNGCLITWISRKQKCVTLSSCESEYVALALAAQEVLWTRSILSELGHGQTTPTIVYEDNQGAIHMAKSNQVTSKSKHIDVRLHFIKELVQQGVFELEYIKTDLQQADHGTKATTGPRYVAHRRIYMDS